MSRPKITSNRTHLRFKVIFEHQSPPKARVSWKLSNKREDASGQASNPWDVSESETTRHFGSPNNIFGSPPNIRLTLTSSWPSLDLNFIYQTLVFFCCIRITDKPHKGVLIKTNFLPKKLVSSEKIQSTKTSVNEKIPKLETLLWIYQNPYGRSGLKQPPAF